MNDQPVRAEFAPQICSFFNRFVREHSLIFDEISENEAAALFLPGVPVEKPGHENAVKVCIAAEENGSLCGFAAGNTEPGKDAAYITAVLAEDDLLWRRLSERLEKELTFLNPSAKKLRHVFYNPALLRWRIPGTDFLHPGAPGVDCQSDEHRRMTEAGYRDFAVMNAYYRELRDYAIPDALTRKMRENEERGLVITEYDPELHGSFLPLIESLGSEDWRGAILRNQGLANPLPMMIAADCSTGTRAKNGGKGFVCGFAGPMYRMDCGRGYFAGIGIHADYRRCGLGSTLFAGLCRGLRSIGADYMTLFTGADGTARKIYEKAGFSVGRTFAGMEKPL